MTRRIRNRRRAGFTLIELLVSIGIIVMLIGLLLPAINKARDAAKRTQAAADMGQLANAVGTFKSKFNASYIPNGPFRLCSDYPTGWPETNYLKGVWPQMNQADNGLRSGGSAVSSQSPIVLDANQTLVFFLTGGPYMNYQGFSNNKQQPFAPVVAQSETRFAAMENVPQEKVTADGHFLDPWRTPYAYFSYDQSVGTYPNVSFNGAAPYKTGSGTAFINPKGFQIISAGRNRTFGPGGAWSPGQSIGYTDTETSAGGDDMSNFNNGAVLGTQG